MGNRERVGSRGIGDYDSCIASRLVILRGSFCRRSKGSDSLKVR